MAKSANIKTLYEINDTLSALAVTVGHPFPDTDEGDNALNELTHHVAAAMGLQDPAPEQPDDALANLIDSLDSALKTYDEDRRHDYSYDGEERAIRSGIRTIAPARALLKALQEDKAKG